MPVSAEQKINDAKTLIAELSPILKTDTIVLAVGVNDTRRSDAVPADFKRLIGVAKDTGAEVFAATISPVDFTKPDGAARDPVLIDAINEQIRSSVEGSRLIDMGRSLNAGETKDGVHLTEAGARHSRSAIEAGAALRGAVRSSVKSKAYTGLLSCGADGDLSAAVAGAFGRGARAQGGSGRALRFKLAAAHRRRSSAPRGKPSTVRGLGAAAGRGVQATHRETSRWQRGPR